MKIFFIILPALFISVLSESDIDNNQTKNDGEVDEIFLLKVLMELGWQFDKVDLISSSVSDIISDYNATVVAFQNIYDDQGNLKEIKTLELVIPKMVMDKKTNKFVKLMPIPSDSDDGQDIFEEVSELREAFHILSKMGMPMQMSVEEYDNDGQLKTEGYLDEDDVYIYTEKMAYLNRTVYVNDKKIVEDYIKENNGGAIPMGILRHDVDGHMIEEGSYISSSSMTTVTEFFGFNATVAGNLITGFTKINLRYPDEIPKQMTEYLDHLYPEFTWLVMRKTDSYSFNEDYNYIVLRNELVDLDVDYEPYMIVGIEKEVVG